MPPGVFIKFREPARKMHLLWDTVYQITMMRRKEHVNNWLHVLRIYEGGRYDVWKYWCFALQCQQYQKERGA